MLAVRTPGVSQAARYSAGCDSAFPFERQGRLLRSRSISGLFSRSLHSGLQPPCRRFATAVTGRHARLGSRLLARLWRGRHRRRQTSTRLQGATLAGPLSRDPVKLFRSFKATKQFPSRTKPFPQPKKIYRNKRLLSTSPIQTTGFDHVGHHHQFNLPPVLPELSGRRTEAAGTMGLRVTRTEAVPDRPTSR